jgi:CheY-like chemotaxis protein
MERKTKHELPLEGLRILVAEDEFLIASAIEDTLREAGAETLRAASVSSALQTLEHQTPSVALLDVRLGRQTTGDLADNLAALHVPFIFYSGHGLPDEVREKHPHAAILLKPVTGGTIIEALRKAAGTHRL